MENNDLGVLNLKQENNSKPYDKLDGTGVKTLRTIATIIVVLGVLLIPVAFLTMADASDYHPERMFYGIFELSSAIVCFVLSPVCRCLATIGEAAKIYKDKNS